MKPTTLIVGEAHSRVYLDDSSTFGSAHYTARAFVGRRWYRGRGPRPGDATRALLARVRREYPTARFERAQGVQS